ncbi:MAG: hypothetical protein HY308_19770 [Gammaproteobacteria bacterium]|nr:hypothetical protein [Gammaproteobacteria bacterium]
MAVYILDTVTNDPKRGTLVFTKEYEEKNEPAYRFGGQPKTEWKPIRLQWFLRKNQKRKNLIIGDFVLVFGAGVNVALNEKAKKVLEPVLGNDAQFLPVEVVGEETDAWYLLNVVNRIDNSVSVEKSHYIELPGGKRVLQRPVFNEQSIPENRVFVYPNAYISAIVRGERLKELVVTHKLTGLKFTPCETLEEGLLPKGATG